MLVLEKPRPKLFLCINIKLFKFLGNKLSSRHLGEKKNSKILAILNQSKDTVNNFIYNSDPKSQDWKKPINIRF